MKEMTWKSVNDGKELVLHLRTDDRPNWAPYTTFPDIKVREGQFSRGWTTMQFLKSQGWSMVAANAPLPQLAHK